MAAAKVSSMPVDRKRASNTTLARAGDCTLGGERTRANPDARNVPAKLRDWKDSNVADWFLASLHEGDAIEWRREVLEVGHCADGG